MIEAVSSKPTAIVIGGGMAGVSSARSLHNNGYEVRILEGRDRLGGRMWSFDGGVGFGTMDLGAAWIHGIKKNPLTNLAKRGKAKRVRTNYESALNVMFDSSSSQYLPPRLVGKIYKEYSAIVSKGIERMQGSTIIDMDLQTAIRQILSNAGNRVKYLKSEKWLRLVTQDLYDLQYAAPTSDLSLWWFDDDKATSGADVLFPNGMWQLGEVVLPKEVTIHLCTTVTKIQSNGDSTTVFTDNGNFVADAVVVTVPLGCLQANTIAFEPALSNTFKNALGKRKMGIYNKVLLRFPKQWWPKRHFFTAISKNGSIPPFQEFLNAQYVSKKPILVAFSSGDTAKSLEDLSDSEIVLIAMKQLREMFPKISIPEPMSHLITRWNSDPFSRGSYSFNKLGVNPDTDFRDILTTHGGRVQFAGEHTNRDYFGTVLGAYYSGISAAKRILGD